MIAVLLILVITTPHILAVEVLPQPIGDTERNIEALRWCLGVLVSQLMVLIEVVNREDVSWEMKAQIKETLEACRAIMKQLGFIDKDE